MRQSNKKKSINGKMRAIALLFLSILSMLTGIWMFYQTRRARLLFLDAGIGRMCGFYWVLLLIALVLFAGGMWTLKRYPVTKDEKSPESLTVAGDVIAQGNTESELSDISSECRLCPSCGKENKKESIFCIYCGSKLDEV